MTDEIDYKDGFDERYNPYSGNCQTHGSWKGPYDECPECMQESYGHESDSIPCSICWNCLYCGSDEPSRFVYCNAVSKLKKLRQKPRKKKCKNFQFVFPGDN